MLTVIVRFTVLPGKMDEFLAGIRINARSSLRDEPGCLRFDVHRSRDDENEVILYEIYDSQEAFEVGHRGSPHYSAWREVVARCVPEGGHVNLFGLPAFPEDLPGALADRGTVTDRWSDPRRSKAWTRSAPEPSCGSASESYTVHDLGELDIEPLPYSLRVVLENLLRHEDGERVTADQVRLLLDWEHLPGPQPRARPQPFTDLLARHQRRARLGRPGHHARGGAHTG